MMMKYAIMLIVLVAPASAFADGGIVRASQTSGQLTVTIFTPPQSSAAFPTDVTIMVQRSNTQEVVMDATVDLSLVPPAGAPIHNDLCCQPATTHAVAGPQSPLRATRAWGANKLLYGASVVLPVVGDWQLRAVVKAGNEHANVNCILPIASPPRRVARLWPYLAMPPATIVLFILNQCLKSRARSPASQED